MGQWSMHGQSAALCRAEKCRSRGLDFWTFGGTLEGLSWLWLCLTRWDRLTASETQGVTREANRNGLEASGFNRHSAAAHNCEACNYVHRPSRVCSSRCRRNSVLRRIRCMSQESHQGTDVWTTLDVGGWENVSMMSMIPRLARLEWITYGDSLTAEKKISCTSACGDNNIYDLRWCWNGLHLYLCVVRNVLRIQRQRLVY